MFNIVIIAIIVVIVAIVFLFVAVGFYLRYFDHAYPIDPELNELREGVEGGDSSAPWRKVRTIFTRVLIPGDEYPILDGGGGKASHLGRYFDKRLTQFGPKTRLGSGFCFILILDI